MEKTMYTKHDYISMNEKEVNELARVSIRRLKKENMYSVGVGNIRHIVPTRWEAKEWLEKFKEANKNHYRKKHY